MTSDYDLWLLSGPGGPLDPYYENEDDMDCYEDYAPEPEPNDDVAEWKQEVEQ